MAERYTLVGIKQMISAYNIKLNELHEQRVAAAHRKQNEHPGYMRMTAEQFKEHQIEFIRWNLGKAREIEAEIRRLEKMMERWH